MKSYQLANGDRMPVLGLGTWKMSDGTAYEAVRSAIKIGYRHLDCAWIYLNESEIGKAITDSINQGDLDREQLFVTSKLWNDQHRGEHVAAALKEQLFDLCVDYLDLYLMHWPVAHQYQVSRPSTASDFVSLDEVPLTETWQAMLECVQSGLCRNVGVANFSVKKLQQLTSESGQAPACNQVESHVLLQQKDLFDYCQENNIAFVAYSPLGSGDRPEGMKKENEPNLFDLPVVHEIAESHQATPAQTMLAWSINRGAIPIPKSSNLARQKENLDAVGIELSCDEMDKLVLLDQHYRFVDGTFWEIEDGPYTVQNLWDE